MAVSPIGDSIGDKMCVRSRQSTDPPSLCQLAFLHFRYFCFILVVYLVLGAIQMPYLFNDCSASNPVLKVSCPNDI